MDSLSFLFSGWKVAVVGAENKTTCCLMYRPKRIGNVSFFTRCKFSSKVNEETIN